MLLVCPCACTLQTVSRLSLFGSRHLYLVPRMLMSIHPAFDGVIRAILVADPLAEIMIMYEVQQEVRGASPCLTVLHRLCPSLRAWHAVPCCGSVLCLGCCCHCVWGVDTGRMRRQLWLEKLRRRLKSDPDIRLAYRRVRFAKKLPEREMLTLMKVAEVIVDTFPVGMGIAALEAYVELCLPDREADLDWC